MAYFEIGIDKLKISIEKGRQRMAIVEKQTLEFI